MSPDSLCRLQVQVSVYCAWWIPAHLRCTQCSILLHIMDIYFLMCIYLWQISQIQTCLCVFVRPGFFTTSQAIQRICMAGLPKNCKSGPHCWGREVSTQFAQQFGTAVAATLLVGCVVWSPYTSFIPSA